MTDDRLVGLPVDEWRRSMQPAVFEAFVSFVGIIPGTPDLDVVEACDSMWEQDDAGIDGQ